MILGSPAGRRFGRVASTLSLMLAAGCQLEYPQSALHPKGEFARITDAVFMQTVWWAVLVFVLVQGALLYAMVRFRGRPGDAEPNQIHGNTTLEIVWTIIPAVILAVIAVPTVKAIFKTYEIPGDNPLTVEVIGHQWWWEFRYPEYKLTTANELHVPVNRTVHLRMGSADVLHSFWVPQFAGKRDVFPNRETRLWFIAEEVGNYPAQCAEFCGIQHGKMAYRVVASEPGDFDGWVAKMKTFAAPPPPPAPAAKDTVRKNTVRKDTVRTTSAGASVKPPAPQEPAGAEGQKLFLAKGCVGCHSLVAFNAPKGMLGPNLANIGARSWIAAGTLPNTDENLAHWIRVPQEVKHGVLMPNLGLSENEAKSIAAYLRTIR
jgi:cytochrome c oxidase subunit 2